MKEGFNAGLVVLCLCLLVSMVHAERDRIALMNLTQLLHLFRHFNVFIDGNSSTFLPRAIQYHEAGGEWWW